MLLLQLEELPSRRLRVVDVSYACPGIIVKQQALVSDALSARRKGHRRRFHRQQM